MVKRKPVSAEYRKYLQSQKWKDLRIAALFRAHNKCQECGADTMLCIHHLRYSWKRQNEPVTDLKVLCRTCHAKTHGRKVKNEYKVKRIVIYKDGSNKIMTGTRSQFKKLWQSDKSIDKVWRISWFKRKQAKESIQETIEVSDYNKTV
jgi:hypothetical protein